MLLSTCDWWVTKCFSCSTLLSPFHMLRVKYRIMLGDPTQAVKDSTVVFCPSLYHCSFHMINCKILKRKLKNNFKINFKVRSADYKNKTKENILRNKFRKLFQYKISLMGIYSSSINLWSVIYWSRSSTNNLTTEIKKTTIYQMGISNFRMFFGETCSICILPGISLEVVLCKLRNWN